MKHAHFQDRKWKGATFRTENNDGYSSLLNVYFLLLRQLYSCVVSVGEDSYQYRSKMNWSHAEFNQPEPKSCAQAEKCKYSIDNTNTDYKVIEIRVQISENKVY